MGVSIDEETDGGGRGGGFEEVGQGAGGGAFDEALEAVVVFDFGVAAGDDGEELEGGGQVLEKVSAQGVGVGEGGVGLFAGEGELDEVAEGGIVERLADVDLFFVKGGVIEAGGLEKEGVVGQGGLEDNLAGELSPSRAAGDLGDELKDVFGGAKVGDVE